LAQGRLTVTRRARACLSADAAEKKREIAEEQRRIKEQIRDEEKALRETERAQAEAEAEEERNPCREPRPVRQVLHLPSRKHLNGTNEPTKHLKEYE